MTAMVLPKGWTLKTSPYVMAPVGLIRLESGRSARMPPGFIRAITAPCARALVEFLDKASVPANVPPAELEGFRTLRREAVRALGQLRTPSLGAGLRPAVPLL